MYHYGDVLIDQLSCLAVASIASALPQAAPSQGASARCWNGTDFPDVSTWISYEALTGAWEQQMMQNSNDTAEEVQDIYSSIATYSAQSGVDNRFIFAVLVRESSGNTATICGDNGLSCGLMQVQGPNVPTCTSHPCPSSSIDQMIKCGVVGCATSGGGSNLQDCTARYGNVVGAAARCYNTGSVTDPNDWSVAQYGNPAYVQDIANMLTVASSNAWALLDFSGTCKFGS